mmetsp:Transcript_41087/g.66140  ORF Transcript_41087/g.66140 Transcript_41087/m.66140 type:complete len:310 (-) Transcript_41087:8928-9857(-)
MLSIAKPPLQIQPYSSKQTHISRGRFASFQWNGVLSPGRMLLAAVSAEVRPPCEKPWSELERCERRPNTPLKKDGTAMVSIPLACPENLRDWVSRCLIFKVLPKALISTNRGVKVITFVRRNLPSATTIDAPKTKTCRGPSLCTFHCCFNSIKPVVPAESRPIVCDQAESAVFTHMRPFFLRLSVYENIKGSPDRLSPATPESSNISSKPPGGAYSPVNPRRWNELPNFCLSLSLRITAIASFCPAAMCPPKVSAKLAERDAERTSKWSSDRFTIQYGTYSTIFRVPPGCTSISTHTLSVRRLASFRAI